MVLTTAAYLKTFFLFHQAHQEKNVVQNFGGYWIECCHKHFSEHLSNYVHVIERRLIVHCGSTIFLQDNLFCGKHFLINYCRRCHFKITQTFADYIENFIFYKNQGFIYGFRWVVNFKTWKLIPSWLKYIISACFLCIFLIIQSCW